ncbi:dynamin-like GTPase family protein [Synechocystis sp. CACIAM 05]|uniref:dynamin-like GTPase family protein n=1 Tax=Synechocystis sp. CACIAM 05 TaxID=1933929 RepID=UPI00138E6145|nr:dynamin-like GTPase family protein [Synechocystis sp. CACIAM 05]QHV00538.1 hypothetical protein BWK47_10650 [Synechocystis sp. CACIAM 05]
MNIEAKLSQARSWLDELGNAISDLVGVAPEVFEDEKLKQDLADFRRAYDQAVQDLANPSLRIAMIGTTSSGKSTIVNALIGRRIAPIEAGEMSGGVLRIKHGEGSHLKIEETEGAVWETGEWSGLSDEEIYNRIQRTMHTYHEVRRKADYIAPQIEVRLPILPACDRELSGLPEGLAIEFVDLPGLKSVQDRENLKIIQSLMGKAFCLVALDYGQIDEEHRQRLLGELKQVVEYFNGKTDSMLFILNRVDNRKSDDIPLENRIAKLSREIEEVLSLSQSLDIISFSANILYQAQCAWGINSLKEKSLISQDQRLKRLKGMLEDCSSFIKTKIKTSKETSSPLPVKETFKKLFMQNQDLKSWFRYIEDRVENNKEINDEMMRILIQYALEWSGGKTLWKIFQSRLNTSLEDLVILPSLKDLLDTLNVFHGSLSLFININTQDSEKISNLKNELSLLKKKFPIYIQRNSKLLNENLNDLIQIIKSSREPTLIKSKLEERPDFDDYKTFLDIVDTVEDDLLINIISYIKKAFRNETDGYEVEKHLSEYLPPYMAKDIAKAYNKVLIMVINPSFTSEGDYLIKKVKVDDIKLIKNLEHNERCLRFLYDAVRKALAHRCEFKLQAEQLRFTEQLDLIVSRLPIKVFYELANEFKEDTLHEYQQVLEAIGFDNAVMSIIQRKIAQNKTELPESLIDIRLKVNVEQDIQEEATGKEKRTGSKDVGSCLNKHKETFTYYVDKKEKIEYKKLSIPSIDKMAEQWGDGIEASKYGKGGLWDILFEWIIENLNIVYKELDIALSDVIDSMNNQINKKIEDLSTREEKLQQISSISILNQHLITLKDDFIKTMRTVD